MRGDIKMDNNSKTNETGLDISKLEMNEELVPLLKNVLTFIELEEYSRANDLADKIINDNPTSPIGWLAKATVASLNFTDRSYGSADAVSIDKVFEKNITNAIKMSDGENKKYILSMYEQYKDTCIKDTEAGVVQMLTAAAEAKTAQLMRTALGGYYNEDKEVVSYWLTKDPENLYFCLMNALLHVNNINYQNLLSGYTYSSGEPILTDETLEEGLGLMALKPRRATTDNDDIFVSSIIVFCAMLSIKAGNLEKYYSDKRLKEIEEENRIADEKRKEEERKRQEELKKEKKKKTIKRIVIFAILIVVVLLLVNPAKNLFENLEAKVMGYSDVSITEFEGKKDKQSYYVMADDCNAINIRTGAGKKNKVVTVIKSRKVKMYPTGTTKGDWIQIETDDYGTAWVNKSVVKFVEK